MQTFKVICVIFLCAASAASQPNKIDEQQLDWWENGVFYQIYPRSFKDSDGDGVGDIRGIIEKLDYLQELGITGAWISPIFKSPMIDFGYDISNFYEVDPIFGTNDDLEELFTKAREKGIKIILDFVPNHSSDQHDWFEKSVNGEKPYDEYYVWRDGRNDNKDPPNNWVSAFHGSAWTFNEKRNQWYYHCFASQQPDLNYRSESLVREMFNVLDFWLKKGAGGFRVDAVLHLFEDEQFRDEPLSGVTKDNGSYAYTLHYYTSDLPEMYESDTYVVLINFGARDETIQIQPLTESIVKHLPEELEISAAGADSCYWQGNTVKSDNVTLRKYDAIVLKVPYNQQSQSRSSGTSVIVSITIAIGCMFMLITRYYF